MRFLVTALFIFLIQTSPLKTSPSYNECSCDLQFSVCDVNCCCDADCSQEDVLVFSGCIDVIPQFDDRLCSHPLTNHSIHKHFNPVAYSSSLFCIFRDNNEERNVHLSKEYKSNQINRDDDTNIPDYSHLISVTFSSNDSDVFGLPYSSFSNLCDSKTAIKFMQDYTSECVQFMPAVANDCVENEDLNALTYQNIALLNNIADITYLICNDDINNCRNENLMAPNFSDDTCQNMVEQVHYYMFFTPPDIVDRVVIKFISQNTTYLNQSLYFKQKFSVTFKLSDESEGTRLSLSGNPGYLKNKFILAGWLKENSIEYNSSPWLQVFDVGFDENCLTANSYPITFGENVITTCFLSVNVSDLQQRCGLISEISQIILYKNLPTHVGAFGNSDPHDVAADWVPIHFPNLPEFTSSDCSNYVSTIRLNLVYVNIGFENNLQAKIIGAKVDYSSPNEIIGCFKYESAIISDNTKIPYFTSVTFTDATAQPINIFAPLPDVDTTVPHDFFYPFTYNSEPKTSCRNILIFVNVFILIFLYLK